MQIHAAARLSTVASNREVEILKQQAIDFHGRAAGCAGVVSAGCNGYRISSIVGIRNTDVHRRLPLRCRAATIHEACDQLRSIKSLSRGAGRADYITNLLLRAGE